MALSAFDSIDDAIAAARRLLTPVEPGAWVRLALLAFFVGGGTGVNAPTTGIDVPIGGQGGPPVSGISPRLGALAVGIVLVVVLVGLAFLAVGSVFEFVLVETLRSGEVHLRRYWGERWRQGLGLLGFRLALGLLGLVAVGGLLALAFAPLLLGGGTLSAVGLLVAVPVAAGLAVLFGLVNGFTTALVVPVMTIADCGVLAGWRRLWPAVLGAPKEYLAYAVVGFVLSLAGGLLVGLAMLVFALVLLIPFGVVAAVGFALLAAAGPIGFLVLAPVGVLYALTVVVVLALVRVPVLAVLRYYAMFVLGDTDGDLDPIPGIREAVRGADGQA